MRDLAALLHITLPETVICSVTHEESGAFPGFPHLPSFVRVCFENRCGEGSLIHSELWLPDHWNGIFVGTGNGRMAGGIVHSNMAPYVAEGYAAANTDMGTSGYPERNLLYAAVPTDFGWRSTQRMTEVSKELIRVYYGREAKKSYFIGASTGGNQALQMAQRFPEAYDGILAGVPANNRIFLHTYFIWNHVHLRKPDGRVFFSDDEIPMITAAAVRFFQLRGDGRPGDNFITRPIQDTDTIHAFLEFLHTEHPSFSEEQLAALEAVYSGPVNSVTGRRIYNGMPIGSEKFGCGIRDCQAPECPFFMPFRWVFGWDYSPYDFDFAADLDKVSSMLSPAMNANNADLTAFRDHGGKLLMYSGTADPCVPYPDAWRYMERVQEKAGGFATAAEFCQYYLLPGMDHGAGGDGATHMTGEKYTSLLDVLRDWRENGNTPETMLAVRMENGGKVWTRTVYPLGSAGFPIKGRPPVCDDWYLETV
ncbi:MAG: tannase/feruloyl esterase family alpha/beta hydrolase [Clostridia bacterium]|nr:tannase/feruloyl esterase family alpha/beta hydrolase [Clostridia bacterium]